MEAGESDGWVRPEGDEVRRSVTIHDVARHAGVSSMTVSRVMNGYKYVSGEMRTRVNAAIAALNFSPNAAARSLQGVVRIGVVYASPSSSNLGNFLMGAFRQSAEGGCQILIESNDAYPAPVDTVEKLIHGGAEAILLPPPLDEAEAVIALLKERGVQAMSFTGAARPDMSSISVDDAVGARLMTEHMIALGHRRIAFVCGNPLHHPARQRESGFRQAMAAAGLTVDETLIAPGYFTYRSGLDAARELLDRPDRPTAIVASNDDMAAAAAAVAHGMGIALPDDLSIGGFDDTPVATTIWPELTTIHQPIAEMSSIAVAMLIDQVRRARLGEQPSIEHRNVALSLIERGSTSAPRCD